jgi:ATP-dependent exoDNAse (exonuclease V) beta subunit
VAAAERRYLTWRQHREDAISLGKTPSLMVRTATEWAASTSEILLPLSESQPSGAAKEIRTSRSRANDIEIVALDGSAERPSGARYGTLVHAALAVVPLGGDPAGIAAVVRTQGRIADATEAEIESAIGVVGTVLAHPLLEQARAAQHARRCLREAPVTMMVDGVLVEGIVDFAFETDGVMTVIDFKTDRAAGDLLAQYRRQLSLYAQAIGVCVSETGSRGADEGVTQPPRAEPGMLVACGGRRGTSVASRDRR